MPKFNSVASSYLLLDISCQCAQQQQSVGEQHVATVEYVK